MKLKGHSSYGHNEIGLYSGNVERLSHPLGSNDLILSKGAQYSSKIINVKSWLCYVLSFILNLGYLTFLDLNFLFFSIR